MYKMKILLRKISRKLFPGREFKKITNEEAVKIIVGREPLGKFWFQAEGDALYHGLDNDSGHAYVESFTSKRECFKWLGNKPAVDSMGHLHEY